MSENNSKVIKEIAARFYMISKILKCIKKKIQIFFTNNIQSLQSIFPFSNKFICDNSSCIFTIKGF